MTLVTRYINGSSNAGGDGTTQHESGANRAFVNWADFEDKLSFESNQNVDLVSSDQSYEFILVGGTSGSNIIFAGNEPHFFGPNPVGSSVWTLDEDHYFRFEAFNGSASTASQTATLPGGSITTDASMFNIVDNASGWSSQSFNPVLHVSADYTRFVGCQFSMTDNSLAHSGGTSTVLEISANSTWFDRCLFHTETQDTSIDSSVGVCGVYVTGHGNKFTNCMFDVNTNNGFRKGAVGLYTTGENTIIYNCAVYSVYGSASTYSQIGFMAGTGGTIIAKNNIVWAREPSAYTTIGTGAFNDASDYNWDVHGTTAPGSNSWNSIGVPGRLPAIVSGDERWVDPTTWASTYTLGVAGNGADLSEDTWSTVTVDFWGESRTTGVGGNNSPGPSVATVDHVIRYINTSSAGGDGTTNGESGSTAAYANLSAWEAAENANLLTNNQRHTVYCDIGSNGTKSGRVNLSGWNSLWSNHIEIFANESGVTGDNTMTMPPSEGRFHVLDEYNGNGGNPYVIQVDDSTISALHIKGLQIRQRTGTSSRYVYTIGTLNNGGSMLLVERCFLHNTWKATFTSTTAGTGFVAWQPDTGASINTTLYGCFVVNCVGVTDSSEGSTEQPEGPGYLCNIVLHPLSTNGAGMVCINNTWFDSRITPGPNWTNNQFRYGVYADDSDQTVVSINEIISARTRRQDWGPPLNDYSTRAFNWSFNTSNLTGFYGISCDTSAEQMSGGTYIDDPTTLFVNSPTTQAFIWGVHDFSLKATAGAVSAGTDLLTNSWDTNTTYYWTAESALTTDSLGTARTGVSWDIGAIQYSTTPAAAAATAGFAFPSPAGTIRLFIPRVRNDKFIEPGHSTSTAAGYYDDTSP